METLSEKLKRLENELEQAKLGQMRDVLFKKYFNLAEFCLENDAYDYGINLLEEVYKQNKVILKNHKYCELLGNLYYKNGILEESLNYYKKYVKLIAKRDDDNVKATVFFNMGKILMLQEKFSSAVGYFKKSEKIYESQGDYSKQAYLLYDIGIECKRRISPDDNDPSLAILGVLIASAIIGSPITTGRRKKGGVLEKTAKILFEKALKILTMQNMLEIEKELVKKLQSELGYIDNFG